jgi:glycosyltransferase 2 family protein
MPSFRFARSRWFRAALVLPFAGLVIGLLLWRGPSLSGIGDAFAQVRWEWVAVAIGINLASVVARSIAWRTVIRAAIDEPRPSYSLVFSAFSVGLFANAVLPGRIGELARVAVLNRKFQIGRGLWATLVGTVVAHRVFDLVPVVLLVLFVLITAKIPTWAYTSLWVVIGVGMALMALAFVSAGGFNKRVETLGPVVRLLTMARRGLGVMRDLRRAILAVLFQILGWMCQLFAVWTAMFAFDIHVPVPAAGLVLLLMNVATIFPLWPGNVGLVQAAVALPLVSYGVGKAHGVAYGFGLQAIEASVGIGVGLIFLGKEGLSFAMLKVMPDAAQAEMLNVEHARADDGSRRERVGVSGEP